MYVLNLKIVLFEFQYFILFHCCDVTDTPLLDLFFYTYFLTQSFLTNYC